MRQQQRRRQLRDLVMQRLSEADGRRRDVQRDCVPSDLPVRNEGVRGDVHRWCGLVRRSVRPRQSQLHRALCLGYQYRQLRDVVHVLPQANRGQLDQLQRNDLQLHLWRRHAPVRDRRQRALRPR